jgi:hypothetical protein
MPNIDYMGAFGIAPFLKPFLPFPHTAQIKKESSIAERNARRERANSILKNSENLGKYLIGL